MSKGLKSFIGFLIVLLVIASAFVAGDYFNLNVSQMLGLTPKHDSEPIPDMEPHTSEQITTIETIVPFDNTGAGAFEITQQKVPYVVDVDFSPVFLKEAQLEKKLIIMTQKANATEKHTKNGLFSLPFFKQTMAIIFHGEGTYYVDLSHLTSDDFVVDNENRTITISIPKPELTVNLKQNETEFLDSSNGALRFGEMELPPATQNDLEIKGIESITKALEADNNTWETAEKFAKLSVKEIYEPLVVAQVDAAVQNADDELAIPAYYTINVEIKD